MPPREYTQQQLYDKYKRNREAKRFYNSAAWQRCRGVVLIRDNYLCQKCLKQGKITTADMVHHIEDLQDAPEKALDLDNLVSLCNPCHNKEHPEKGRRSKQQKNQGVDVVTFAANEELI